METTHRKPNNVYPTKNIWLIIIALLVFTNCLLAQKHNEAYEDVSLGWIKIYNYKGAIKPLQHLKKICTMKGTMKLCHTAMAPMPTVILF